MANEKKKGLSVPPEIIGQIKQKVNLVEVVSEVVLLKKSGSRFVGLCPFHNERSPSFSIFPEKGFFYCFGCQAHGDVIAFLQQTRALSFPEALSAAALLAGVSLAGFQLQDGAPDGLRQQFTVAFKLNRVVMMWFSERLLEDVAARAYLLDRGIDQKLWDRYFLGFGGSEVNALFLRLKKIQAPLDVAELMGFFKRKNHAQEMDLFSRRVIFPVVDFQGRVVGFGGRALLSSQQPKYLNSPESFVYVKSKELFGLFQARPYIRELGFVIVVEGYTDVLALSACGMHNVVASCGTALTVDHVQFLKRIADRIVLMYDGDAAGKAAMVKGLMVGLSVEVELQGVWLKDGEDPQSFLWDAEKKAYRSAAIEWLQEQVQTPVSLLDWALRQEAAYWKKYELDSSRQNSIAQKLAKILVWVKRQGQLMQHLQNLDRHFGVSSDRLLAEIREERRKLKTGAVEKLATDLGGAWENGSGKGGNTSKGRRGGRGVLHDRLRPNMVDEAFLCAIIQGGVCFELFRVVAARYGVQMWVFFSDPLIQNFVRNCEPYEIKSLQEAPCETFARFLHKQTEGSELLKQYEDIGLASLLERIVSGLVVPMESKNFEGIVLARAMHLIEQTFVEQVKWGVDQSHETSPVAVAANRVDLWEGIRRMQQLVRVEQQTIQAQGSFGKGIPGFRQR